MSIWLKDVEEDRDGFGILSWWKVNLLRFPSLEMTHDVLVIPISSVKHLNLLLVPEDV